MTNQADKPMELPERLIVVMGGNVPTVFSNTEDAVSEFGHKYPILAAMNKTRPTQPTASGEAFERIVKYQLSSSSASYEEITGGEWLGDMMAVQKALAQPEPIDVAKNDFGDISEFNVKSGNMVNRVMVPVLGFETHEQRNAARKYLERGLLNGTAGEK